VPETVVHKLEPIEIEKEHSEVAPTRTPSAAAQDGLEVVQEERPVGEVREGVVQRFPTKLLANCEVGERSGNPDGTPILMDRDTPAQHGPVGAVVKTHPMLIRQSVGLASEVLVDIVL